MTIKSVAIVGSSGWLGSLITHQLVKDGFEVFSLVRDVEKTKKKLGDAKVTYVETDFSTVEGITKAITGKDALVSAVAGDDKVFVELQKRLIDAAKASGVKLFVPSEFGSDIARIPRGGIFELKQQLDEYLDKSGVPAAKIRNGAFYEFGFSPLAGFDLANGTFTVGGDGSKKNAYTHTTDIAKAVSAVLKQNKTGPIYIAGAVVSDLEVLEIVEKTLGIKLKLITKTIEELQKEASEAKEYFPGIFIPTFKILVAKGLGEYPTNFDYGEKYTVQDYLKTLKK